MITELLLQNFRAHASTRIPLGRLTVLVGPNAAGKSSVLEALLLLSRLLDEEPAKVFVGKYDLRWIVRRGATEDLKVEVSGAMAESAWSFLLQTPSDGSLKKARVTWDERARLDPEGEAILMKLGPGFEAPRARRPAQGAYGLQGAVALRLEGARLAEPSYSEEELPRLAEGGYGLATVLSSLKLTATDTFHELEALARRIVPTLEQIGFKRTRLEQPAFRPIKVEDQQVLVHDTRTVIADELVLDFKNAPGLPAHAASEGTLIVLGILCAMFSPSQPRLILLDDVERALHPKAQHDLVAAIRAALTAAPELQIVATTHSPYLVDALQPEEVVVVARDPSGAVAAKRLSENPKARLLDVLTTGELWTAEGEGWVTEA